ncbi:hypothetical protein A3781_08090 [Bacillus badius]|nr:hypothetical protein A3781_08090 [Bacillus badius]
MYCFILAAVIFMLTAKTVLAYVVSPCLLPLHLILLSIGNRFKRSSADLSGADLRGSIFLTQAQINAAKGSLNTKLPPALIHPPHWFACSP